MKPAGKLSAFALICCALLHVAQSPAPQRAGRVKRLIGGTAIESNKAWPWVVHIHGKVATDFFFGFPYKWRSMYCGGTVIGSQWVLTAAHCFRLRGNPERSEVPKYWHVKAGAVDNSPSFWERVKSFFGRERLYMVHASAIYIHPEYNQYDSWKNDIAILKLRSPLPLTGEHPRIRSAVLPPAEVTDWPGDNADCIMVGWGCTENGRGITKYAQIASMPKMPDVACSNRYGVIDLLTRFCAGYNNQGIGICAGDSGGPLVCRENGYWLLAGVASFTSGKDPANFPGVFTKVSKYVNWINLVKRP